MTNPDGGSRGLQKGFRICERRELDLVLDPIDLPASSPIRRRPLRWRMRIDGDERLFSPDPLHQAMLLLPELPLERETTFVPGSEQGKTAIELHLTPTLGFANVKLIGEDAAALQLVWDEIEEAGGIALPAIDQRHYGDLDLTLQRTPASRAPIVTNRAVVERHPLVYRYEFANGELTAARARGTGVDHVFRASATYDWTCEVEDSASYVDTVLALCEERAAEHPRLVVQCTP